MSGWLIAIGHFMLILGLLAVGLGAVAPAWGKTRSPIGLVSLLEDAFTAFLFGAGLLTFIVGFLLILKKKVWHCRSCGAVLKLG